MKATSNRMKNLGNPSNFSSSKNIYLVGMPGTGKSRLGQALANRLNYRFFDLDGMIEKHCKISVSDIILREGEPKFRSLETKMLEELLDQTGVVVATGGGAMKSAHNRDMVISKGTPILLTASPSVIAERLNQSPQLRPLLGTPITQAKVEKLWNERRHILDKFTNVVNTDNIAIDELTDAVIKIIESSQQ